MLYCLNTTLLKNTLFGNITGSNLIGFAAYADYIACNNSFYAFQWAINTALDKY